jgi:hypothetical protein
MQLPGASTKLELYSRPLFMCTGWPERPHLRVLGLEPVRGEFLLIAAVGVW